jgi:hypothetical protein
MRIMKLASSLVTAAALLVGCTNTQSASSTNALGSDFIAAFRQAHDHRDLEAMSKLYCWDRVTPEAKKSAEDYLRGTFDDKIVGIKLTTEHPQGRPDVYVRDGVTYRFNLPVVAELVVQNPPLSKDASDDTYYPLGTRDDRYLIAQMAPVRGSEAHETPVPSGLPEQTNQPSQSRRTTEAAQSAVVPVGTVLMVRLEEDLGLKTVKAGGKFFATVAQPVVVNGVVVIPAGSRVQGIAEKDGDYSPDATLTSVTVNGKPQKISTGSMTFNEGVVFPAGSEMKFELAFPLKLAE